MVGLAVRHPCNRTATLHTRYPTHMVMLPPGTLMNPRVILLALLTAAALSTSGHAQDLWPSARTGGHVLAYDAARRTVVLIGGDGVRQEQTQDSTWLWSGSWRAARADGPGWRSLPAIAYDSRRHRVVLNGGVGKTGQEAYASAASGDTWAWDGAAWRELPRVGPGARDHHTMVYDSASDMLVLHGGSNTGEFLPGTTYGFDGTAWRELAAAESGPGERVHHAMVYDSRRRRVVLYGGAGRDRSGARMAETWEWDGTRWERVSSTGPGPRSHHRMAYDAARGVTLMFGGNDDPRTWAWNGTEWRVVAERGPSPRMLHAMTYDAVRERVILFGGSRGADELWEWDGQRWKQVTT